MTKNGVAFAVVVGCLVLLAAARPVRAQCAYGDYEILYAQTISGTSNLFDTCRTTSGLQTANVSASLGVYPASNSKFTGWTISSSQFGVVFQAASGHLLEPYYTSGTGWAYTDLTSATGGTAAISGTPLGSFGDGHGQHVFYVGTDGAVHQMLYNGSWQEQTLSSASSVASGSQLASYEYNSIEFVVYQGTNGDVDELSFNGSSWTDANLTTATGGELPTNGTAFTGVDSISPNGAQLLYFVGADGNIHEYSDTSSGWSDHAVVVSGAPAPAPNTRLIFFEAPTTLGQYTYFVSYVGGAITNDGGNGYGIFADFRAYNTYSWDAYDVITQGGAANPPAINVTLGGVSIGIPDYVYFSGNQAGSTPPPSVTLLIPSSGVWHATSSTLLS
ncbi:MAG: hypothetical protein WBF30_06050, partial [Candidatus Acidiferrales bacterium]